MALTKGLRSTAANQYIQNGFWRKGLYTYQAIVYSGSGYAFAFQYEDLTWETFDLSWQVQSGEYCQVEWTFTLAKNAIAFSIVANDVASEVLTFLPMFEQGSNKSTPIANEEDLRGMDGDFHEFIFTRNDTGIAPDPPLSTQEDDLEPEGWTDNPKGVTKELPFEFVSMREKKNGVWLDFSPPSLWAKWSEDGLSVNIRVQGHYQSHWEGVNKITEIVGGEIINGTEVIKCTAIFRKGEEDIASDIASSRGFIWEVNGVEIARDVPYITLDESYGDGFADYVTLSYLIGNKRESDQAEILNISEGMDGIGEEFIFKANNSDTVPPVLPKTTDVGYQNDDYHGDWSDNPVAPTESNQFVWVAKRKKVGGIWEAFGTPSVWTKWVKDGDGILEVLDYYGVSLDSNVLPTDWFTTVPTKGANEYLWNYERILYTDGTYDETEPRVIQGKDAKSISTVVNQYVYSSSDTSHPTSGWKSTIAELGAKPEGYFLWVRDFITYTDGTTDTTSGYVVKDGDDGDGITSTTIHYAKSSSGTTPPTSGWSTSLPSVTLGWYLWTRTTTTYKKSATTEAYSVSRYADDGDPSKTITLSANTTKITVGQGNVSSPTQVSVKATAVNTTVETWEYSIDGGAFTATKPSFVTVVSTTERTVGSSTLFKTITLRASRVADEASDIITISREGGAPYVDSTTRTWWEWNDSSNLYVDTGMSPVGVDGAIPYPAGYYDSTKRYRREQDYTPYVQYGEILYLLIKDTPYAGIPPTNTTYWKAFNQWEAVFVDSLVAKFAKIGGAVFTGDTSNVSSNVRGRLISQKGIDNTSNYNSYTGDSGSWQPKLMLDFETGKAKFSDTEITGIINALSGSIGGLTIEDGKLYVGNINGNRIEIDPYNRRIRLINNAAQLIGEIAFSSGDTQYDIGAMIEMNHFYQGVKRSSARLGGVMSDVTIRTYNTSGVKIGETNYRHDGVYINGQKVDMGGGSDYVHPSTHPADMITAGTLQGKVVANNNTDLTKQVRNIRFSTNNPASADMQDGDVWIKYAP